MRILLRDGRRQLAPVLVGALGIGLLLAGWQWGSGVIGSETALPAVPTVLSALGKLFGASAFWLEVLTTLGIAVLGWAIAGVLGVAIGVLVGTSEVAHAATRVVLEFLRPIPAIVILPLAMLVLGPTTEMGIFLVVFGVMLPIAAQTAAGVESVDPVMRNTARSFGMGNTETLMSVVIPGASPYIGTAMRVAGPVTLIMTVVAGMLGGAPGIGNSLTVAQIAGRNDDLFAYVIVLGLMGLLVQWAFSRAEHGLLHWHAAYRKAE